MDTSEMRELLQGCLGEIDWRDGATKDDLMVLLAGRAGPLRTMVNQCVADGAHRDADAVLNVIPAQAWQAVQGDAWRGSSIQYAEDVPSNFRAGPVGRDAGDVYRTGDPPPPTRGFGRWVIDPDADAATGGLTAGSHAGGAPHGGRPGDGAGRVEDSGTQHAGVWPVSGPPSGNPDAPPRGMASFGQGERGAAGFADSGRSEVRAMPPGDARAGEEPGARGTASAAGDVGSNAGEVDPGVSGTGATLGGRSGDAGGAGFGNAAGGSFGDIPPPADRPPG